MLAFKRKAQNKYFHHTTNFLLKAGDRGEECECNFCEILKTFRHFSDLGFAAINILYLISLPNVQFAFPLI
jgi:hypothetical protein